MTLSEYTQLKNQVVYNVGKCENYNQMLNKLKEFYKDDIDSERRFEQINTIGQLLKILEIRDVLSEDNIVPLKEIARKLNDNELLSRLLEYENRHITREYTNYYAIKHLPQKEFITTVVNNHPFENMSPNKTKRIDDTIIEEIGVFWRDLGRNLKIREGKIDEIDALYPNLSHKASELLKLYKDRADPQRWFFVLCEALEKSRRKDLSRNLQEIMSMNI